MSFTKFFFSAVVVASLAGVLSPTVQASDYLGDVKAAQDLKRAQRMERMNGRMEHRIEKREKLNAAFAKACAKNGNFKCAEAFAKRADKLDEMGDRARNRKQMWDAVGDNARITCKKAGTC